MKTADKDGAEFMSKFCIYIRGFALAFLIIAALSLLALANPGLNLTKSCNAISANIDDTIIYTFNLRNNGTEQLINPTLLDDHLGEITINKRTLDAGESHVVSVSYRIKESDLPGPLVNLARAKAVYKGADVFSNNASFAVSLGIAGYENLTRYGYMVPDLINTSTD